MPEVPILGTVISSALDKYFVEFDDQNIDVKTEHAESVENHLRCQVHMIDIDSRPSLAAGTHVMWWDVNSPWPNNLHISTHKILSVLQERGYLPKREDVVGDAPLTEVFDNRPPVATNGQKEKTITREVKPKQNEKSVSQDRGKNEKRPKDQRMLSALAGSTLQSGQLSIFELMFKKIEKSVRPGTQEWHILCGMAHNLATGLGTAINHPSKSAYLREILYGFEKFAYHIVTYCRDQLPEPNFQASHPKVTLKPKGERSNNSASIQEEVDA
jgi:hypothetical protein